MANDLGYGDLSCYGSTNNETPNVDALAASGLRFTDFHSSSPFCTSNRVATLGDRGRTRSIEVHQRTVAENYNSQESIKRADQKIRLSWRPFIEMDYGADLTVPKIFFASPGSSSVVVNE